MIMTGIKGYLYPKESSYRNLADQYVSREYSLKRVPSNAHSTTNETHNQVQSNSTQRQKERKREDKQSRTFAMLYYAMPFDGHKALQPRSVKYRQIDVQLDLALCMQKNRLEKNMRWPTSECVRGSDKYYE